MSRYVEKNLGKDEEIVESHDKKSKIVLLIILVVLILFLPFIHQIVNSFFKQQQSKLEDTVLTSENYTSASSIVSKTIDYLKSGDTDSIKSLLSNDCEFYNDGTKYSLSSCLDNLLEYESCKYEKRGNSIKNEETYRVYWNGSNLENAHQIITLVLKRKVTQSEITYEIKHITLSNNVI